MHDISIRKTHDNIKNKLVDYIKAQYLAENDLLLNAANEILHKKEVLYQEPYIEVTKNFKIIDNGFLNTKLDYKIKNILQTLIESKLGVFNTPFLHQVNAIEEYYNGKDILVTTSTGSGKTECFLWPILTDMIQEARYNKISWQKEGIRALVLYPMNALVSDQLGRMRSIIGRKDDAYHKILSENERSRRARFGMYTGRTSYAGKDNEKKNKKLGDLIQEYYIDTNAYDDLMEIGRIPSKNLERFVDNLKRGIQKTDQDDSELFTRGEMQKICPDILITNYSMLEYMLMRPIEDSFWSKTIDWLNTDEKNKLLLVIDEAHMYRGAAGGEVSLLIRRLMDKLRIDEAKLKCILTSASVPSDNNNELQSFASALTGKNPKNNNYVIIREELDEISITKCGNLNSAEFYASLSLKNIQGEFEQQSIEYRKLIQQYTWSELPNEEKDVGYWLFENLSKDSLMNHLIFICSEKGKSFTDIAKELFDRKTVEIKLAKNALEVLLQLGTMARAKTGKALLGSKVHMLFKGLQGLYACINPDCIHSHKGMGIRLGSITNESRELCECGSRIFELHMDRRCGTLYICAFIDEEVSNVEPFDFLWPKHNKIMMEPQEIHLWIMPENRVDIFKLNKKSGKAKDNSVIGYIDSKTGLLFKEESHSEEKGFIKVLISRHFSKENNAYSFDTCPNCGKDHNRITPFYTRGNEPFANIVREQFESQVIKDKSLNNEGKKVLLFSDSRQRAATLARDMTIASDGDAGRQAIFMAQKLLNSNSREDRTLNLLYHAFLKVVYDNKLSFFYGEEGETFKNHIKKFDEIYGDSRRIIFSRVYIGTPPHMFYQLLLKNISNNYRSFNNIGLGQVVLAESGLAGEDVDIQILEKVNMKTGIAENDIRSIYNTWIQYLLVSKMAIFPNIDDGIRNSILTYDRGGFGIDEKESFPEFISTILKEHGILQDEIQILRDIFDNITDRLDTHARTNNRKYMIAERLELKTAEDGIWYKCHRCSGVSTYTLWEHCIYCGSKNHIHIIDKMNLDRYSLWRNPVLNALNGEKIRNIITEEHTAQLSHRDNQKNIWGTTEKHELAFRNIILNEAEEPIDILSCTTTMEVGIDIGSLTSVGLRNVPPMRENYQQRAGRAGRNGTAVSSIVTYTENGPHDAWYFKHPNEIISGKPRIPWIDSANIKLVKRHINLILLQEYLKLGNDGLDEVNTMDFFDSNNPINYIQFMDWTRNHNPLNANRKKILLPVDKFDWELHLKELETNLQEISLKIKEAPFVYTSNKDNSNSQSNSHKLLDVLYTEGLLPNYSFPRNIVSFWIEDHYGYVKERPERSIDIALSEYAPGRLLVVNKQTYISGGIYDYYSKFGKNNFKAAELWLELEEYKKDVYCCTNSLCGWFGISVVSEECPLCGDTVEKHIMIKPWGFVAREGRSVPETHENEEMSFASQPSYSSMPSGGEMEKVGSSGYIKLEYRENQKLVITNKGPEDKGFQLCSYCGATEPDIVNPIERNERKRPYKIPYIKDDNMKCQHNFSNIYLGYEFNTDLMVLEIKLDGDKLDLDVLRTIWLLPALTTISESLALAASRELDVEFSDMKSGFRIRNVGDSVFADIYLYDSLSSGAGYAVRASKLINSVLGKMKEILEECSCSTACPNCLQHFWNQRNKNNLDRFLGRDFLEFIISGNLKTTIEKNEQEYYFEQINRIAYMQGFDRIIFENNDKFYLKTKDGDKRIIIYPAMCNPKIFGKNNNIYISDRMCKYATTKIWRDINYLLA